MALSKITSASIHDATVTAADLASGAAKSNFGPVLAGDLAAGAARANFGAGAVLQVVHFDYATYQAITIPTNTNTSTATGLTATITPSSASSKILVLCSANLGHDGSSTVVRALVQRTGPATANSVLSSSTSNNLWSSVVYTPTPSIMYPNELITWLDSPNSTAACTYTLRIGGNTASYLAMLNGAAGYGAGWGGTSHLTLMEIAG